MSEQHEPTTADTHLDTARAALNVTTNAIAAARLELEKLETRIPALLATDEIVRALLIEWEEVNRAASAHFAATRGQDVYNEQSPNLEAQREWSLISGRRHTLETKLRAIATELLESSRREAAPGVAA